MNAVLALSLALVAGAPLSNSKKSAPQTQRESSRRKLEVVDSTSEVAISVAGAAVTTLYFPQNVASALVPDPDGRLDGAPQVQGPLVMVKPTKDLPQPMAMQVTLADGTILPPFILTSNAKSYDLFVDVAVNLQHKVAGDSAVALRAQVTELQGKLDECQQSAGDRGALKVGELVLKQDPHKPVAFVVEKHPARKLDKQSRLLVETLHVYRLFDVSYLVLTVENRDPDKLWVLERAEVAVGGGGSNVEARVLDVAQEMSQGIPPGTEAKLVVVYKTPEQATNHDFTLRLFEKAGNRHVVLEGIKL